MSTFAEKTAPIAIAGLQDIAESYSVVLCDVWGVIHNGVDVYFDAADALQQFRSQGGKVVLITNSPRPSPDVMIQFDQLGVPIGTCDEIVTSGDVTRELVRHAEGPIYHIGPQRDVSFFDGLGMEFSSLEDAATIVCTGLVDDEAEEPDDYRELLQRAAEKKLPFICANPDIVVERGDQMIFCAGALAQFYGQLGGKTLLAGKPHKPIYEVALAKAGVDGDTSRVLCIGDGMPTDVAGAQDAGLDLLYISAGIHAAEYGPADAPNWDRLAAFLKHNNALPVATMPRLSW